MSYSETIADALAGVLNHYTWTQERDVLLGDYQGNILATSAPYPRSVYWHNQGSEIHEVGTAVLASDSNILYQENSSYASNPPMITIGYPPRSTVLTVKGMSSSLATMQAQGTYSQLEQYMLRLGNPLLYNITDWRVGPYNPVGTSVVIQAGQYIQPSSPGIIQAFAGSSYSLSTAISALTSGQHQMTVVYYDLYSASLGNTSSTAVTATGALPSRSELTGTTLASIILQPHWKPLGVVYLYYGQTAVQEADFYRTLETRWAQATVENAAPARLYAYSMYL